jgi:Transposase DDE domain group 1
MGSSHILDQLDTCFDDTHAVANAGLLLPATLAERLGIEQAADQVIDLGERAGAYRPGRKLLTLVHAMLAGGDCIDDADLLRCGQTASVLGHRVMAPSTLGTFLRSFTFGHVRQLDRLTEQTLKRAWAAGAGPGDGPMTMDLDSTVCQVHGYHKQGAAYGYTHTLGYHPLVATRADRRCCICLVRGVLRPPRGLASDRQGQLVECDRHPPGHRFLDGQFVMATPQVLYEGMPGDHDLAAAILLEPAHRTQPRLQTAVVGLDVVVGVAVVRCHVAGSNSSSAIG